MSLLGAVTDSLEPMLAFELIGPQGNQIGLIGLVDTGYNGGVAVSASVVSELRLPFYDELSVTLADGQQVMTRRYVAEMLWDDIRRSVLVTETAATDPAIGTSVLAGYRLTIDIVPGGMVSVAYPD